MEIRQYRLAKHFGMSAEFWLNLPARYEREVETDNLESRLDKEVKTLAA